MLDSDGNERFWGLLFDGVEVDRLKPNAAAALGLRDFVIRDERAGVAWNDISK